MKFTLTIELGNEAMSDGAAIAAALRKEASVIEHYDEGGLARWDGKGLSSSFRDTNGNKVGKWKVTK